MSATPGLLGAAGHTTVPSVMNGGSGAAAGDDWDSHWASYAASNALNPAQAYRRKLIFDALALGAAPAPVRVLEIGSGQGEL